MVDTKIDGLAGTLRQRLNKGEFGTSGRLPPFRELANQLHTTQETTNKVIHLLQSEGLLVVKGKSVYVNPVNFQMPAMVPHFDRYIESQGLVPISTFLEPPDLVSIPFVIADKMGLDECTLVPHRLLRQGVQKGDTVVHVRLSENFYNPELVKDEIFEGLRSNPQFDTLIAIKNKYGKAIENISLDATSRLPTSNEQKLLEVVRGTPMMEFYRTSYTSDGLVVMVNKIVFVGHYVKLSVKMPISF